MIENLKSKQARRILFSLVVVGLVALFLVRYFYLPYHYQEVPDAKKTIESVLEGLFSTILTTVLISAFIVWISVDNEDKDCRTVEPIAIEEELGKARNDTDFWCYSGSVGRYTRTRTLPELASIAKNTNRRKSIKISIVDPSDDRICEEYARFRSALSSSKKFESWDVGHVKLDLTASIVTAYLLKIKQESLDIEVSLKNSFSVFRYDLSSNKAIITREDPRNNAFMYNKGCTLYQCYLDDFNAIFNQGRRLDPSAYLKLSTLVKGSKGTVDLTKINADLLNQFMSTLGLDLTFSDTMAKKVLEIIVKNKNQYS